MNIPALLTLIITITAAILLISEKLRPDLVALMVMVVLGLTGLVPVDQAFGGFSGTPVITILGISIISASLYQTGTANRMGLMIQKIGGQNERRILFWVMIFSAALSLFMNNIAAVGVLLPAVMTLSRKTRIRPAKLMMPLAFGSILGGMATLLTTSNIIMSSSLTNAGYKSYGLLDFLPIGIPIILVGVIYMVTIGKSYLDSRPSISMQDNQIKDSLELFSIYKLDTNLFEIEIMEDSPLIKKSIEDCNWRQTIGVNIIALKRNRELISEVGGDLVLLPGDHLFVHGEHDVETFDFYHISIVPQETDLGYTGNLTTGIAEVVIGPHSGFIGKTLRDIKFRDKFQLNVLAIWRGSDSIKSDLPDIPLQGGDALLIQGKAKQIRLIRNVPDLVLLEEDPDAVLYPQKQNIAIVITVISLLIAALGHFPIALVVMTGAILLLLTGCLSMNDVFEKMEWKAIFLIAGMWPLSIAIRTSGLSDLIVKQLFTFFDSSTPLIFAAVLIILTFIMTQAMSGQISALVLAPIALSAAQSMGVDPRSMGMAVALGCSLAFPTPFGHPVNIMVMSPGGYTIKDYLLLGAPLTILIFVVIIIGLRLFWGL
jgi:di/tricarboxylate transporter